MSTAGTFLGIRPDLAFEDAACRQVDPELFFPEHVPGYQAQVRAAVAICRTCPADVVRACAREAVQSGTRFGVWAGVHITDTTVVQRRQRLAAIAGIREQAPPSALASYAQAPARNRADHALRMLADGTPPDEIAERLGISLSTVRRYRRRHAQETT
jgi:WhiB family redox-sensing transcriptional regulator